MIGLLVKRQCGCRVDTTSTGTVAHIGWLAAVLAVLSASGLPIALDRAGMFAVEPTLAQAMWHSSLRMTTAAMSLVTVCQPVFGRFGLRSCATRNQRCRSEAYPGH